MRILMLAYAYPPLIGGVERHVRNLSIELAKRGHDVAVATLMNPGLCEFEVDQGVRIYRLRGMVHRIPDAMFKVPQRRFAPSFPDPELVFGLRQVIKRERPQIVHAHNWMVRSFLPIKRWSKASLIVTLHSYGLECAKWTMMRGDAPCSGPEYTKCLGCSIDHYGVLNGAITCTGNRVCKEAEKDLVDIFLPVSEAVASGNFLAAHHLPYQVVPNFVPDNVAILQNGYEKEVSQLPKGGYILFVGALTQKKGPEILLKAYAGLSNPPPLVFIGSTWPETPKNLSEKSIVLENWDHGAVMHAWRNCSIGVIPSLCLEACPTVALEGMAVGRPVIGSRIGGIPELIEDGKNGFLFPAGDALALQEKLHLLLTDQELYAYMSQESKRRFVEFQASSIVPRIEEIYRKVSRS